MTDKATVEIPSPRAGTIAKINFKDGEICPVGEVLVVIEEAGGCGAAPEATSRRTARPRRRRAAAAPRAPAAAPPRGDRESAVADRGRRRARDRARVLATPATRRLARQLGVELGRVPATGKHGRVTTDDVKRFEDAAPRAATAAAPPVATRRSRSPRAATRSGSRCAACASASPRPWRARCTPPRTSPTSRRST